MSYPGSGPPDGRYDYGGGYNSGQAPVGGPSGGYPYVPGYGQYYAPPQGYQGAPQPVFPITGVQPPYGTNLQPQGVPPPHPIATNFDDQTASGQWGLPPVAQMYDQRVPYGGNSQGQASVDSSSSSQPSKGDRKSQASDDADRKHRKGYSKSSDKQHSSSSRADRTSSRDDRTSSRDDRTSSRDDRTSSRDNKTGSRQSLSGDGDGKKSDIDRDTGILSRLDIDAVLQDEHLKNVLFAGISKATARLEQSRLEQLSSLSTTDKKLESSASIGDSRQKPQQSTQTLSASVPQLPKSILKRKTGQERVEVETKVDQDSFSHLSVLEQTLNVLRGKGKIENASGTDRGSRGSEPRGRLNVENTSGTERGSRGSEKQSVKTAGALSQLESYNDSGDDNEHPEKDSKRQSKTQKNAPSTQPFWSVDTEQLKERDRDMPDIQEQLYEKWRKKMNLSSAKPHETASTEQAVSQVNQPFQTEQAHSLVSSSQTKKAGDDDEELDSTVQNILQSIGFNFDLSKRMQELARQKKMKQDVFSTDMINQSASFLGQSEGLVQDVRAALFSDKQEKAQLDLIKEARASMQRRSGYERSPSPDSFSVEAHRSKKGYSRREESPELVAGKSRVSLESREVRTERPSQTLNRVSLESREVRTEHPSQTLNRVSLESREVRTEHPSQTLNNQDWEDLSSDDDEMKAIESRTIVEKTKRLPYDKASFSRGRDMASPPHSKVDEVFHEEVQRKSRNAQRGSHEHSLRLSERFRNEPEDDNEYFYPNDSKSSKAAAILSALTSRQKEISSSGSKLLKLPLGSGSARIDVEDLRVTSRTAHVDDKSDDHFNESRRVILASKSNPRLVSRSPVLSKSQSPEIKVPRKRAASPSLFPMPKERRIVSEKGGHSDLHAFLMRSLEQNAPDICQMLGLNVDAYYKSPLVQSVFSRLNLGGLPATERAKSPVRSDYLRRDSVRESPVRQVSRAPDRWTSRSPGRRLSGSPGRRLSRSPGRRLSRSPGRRLSRPPEVHPALPDRRMSLSPVRQRLRSPGRRLSRSPVMQMSRSPVMQRSRSPGRLLSRSPNRRKSMSPGRQKSRSFDRNTSRSPDRRKSISPGRRRSRSLDRRRSKSLDRHRSRSPDRKKARSPDKLRSRSPGRRTSRSPVRPRSRSPGRRTSRSRSPGSRPSRSPVRPRSRSLDRRKSKSPNRRRSISVEPRKSRSPGRVKARSPLRARSRSPARRKSRSLSRHRSGSPGRRRSRSPRLLPLRARSPARHRSRSPSRRRSRSPSRHRSRSPSRRRSRSPRRLPLRARSPDRRNSLPERPQPQFFGKPRGLTNIIEYKRLPPPSLERESDNRSASARTFNKGSKAKHPTKAPTSGKPLKDRRPQKQKLPDDKGSAKVQAKELPKEPAKELPEEPAKEPNRGPNADKTQLKSNIKSTVEQLNFFPIEERKIILSKMSQMSTEERQHLQYSILRQKDRVAEIKSEMATLAKQQTEIMRQGNVAKNSIQLERIRKDLVKLDTEFKSLFRASYYIEKMAEAEKVPGRKAQAKKDMPPTGKSKVSTESKNAKVALAGQEQVALGTVNSSSAGVNSARSLPTVESTTKIGDAVSRISVVKPGSAQVPSDLYSDIMLPPADTARNHWEQVGGSSSAKPDSETNKSKVVRGDAQGTGAARLVANQEKVYYEYYDSGNHWCRQCTCSFGNVNRLLLHNHTKSHLTAIVKHKKPWKDEEKKTKRKVGISRSRQIKGVEVMFPVQGFYCRLCREFCGDILDATDHLKSDSHYDHYMEFIKKNPLYEKTLLLEKTGVHLKNKPPDAWTYPVPQPTPEMKNKPPVQWTYPELPLTPEMNNQPPVQWTPEPQPTSVKNEDSNKVKSSQQPKVKVSRKNLRVKDTSADSDSESTTKDIIEVVDMDLEEDAVKKDVVKVTKLTKPPVVLPPIPDVNMKQTKEDDNKPLGKFLTIEQENSELEKIRLPVVVEAEDDFLDIPMPESPLLDIPMPEEEDFDTPTEPVVMYTVKSLQQVKEEEEKKSSDDENKLKEIVHSEVEKSRSTVLIAPASVTQPLPSDAAEVIDDDIPLPEEDDFDTPTEPASVTQPLPSDAAQVIDDDIPLPEEEDFDTPTEPASVTQPLPSDAAEVIDDDIPLPEEEDFDTPTEPASVTQPLPSDAAEVIDDDIPLPEEEDFDTPTEPASVTQPLPSDAAEVIDDDIPLPEEEDFDTPTEPASVTQPLRSDAAQVIDDDIPLPEEEDFDTPTEPASVTQPVPSDAAQVIDDDIPLPEEEDFDTPTEPASVTQPLPSDAAEVIDDDIPLPEEEDFDTPTEPASVTQPLPSDAVEVIDDDIPLPEEEDINTPTESVMYTVKSPQQVRGEKEKKSSDDTRKFKEIAVDSEVEKSRSTVLIAPASVTQPLPSDAAQVIDDDIPMPDEEDFDTPTEPASVTQPADAAQVIDDDIPLPEEEDINTPTESVMYTAKSLQQVRGEKEKKSSDDARKFKEIAVDSEVEKSRSTVLIAPASVTQPLPSDAAQVIDDDIPMPDEEDFDTPTKPASVTQPLPSDAAQVIDDDIPLPEEEDFDTPTQPASVTQPLPSDAAQVKDGEDFKLANETLQTENKEVDTADAAQIGADKVGVHEMASDTKAAMSEAAETNVHQSDMKAVVGEVEEPVSGVISENINTVTGQSGEMDVQVIDKQDDSDKDKIVTDSEMDVQICGNRDDSSRDLNVTGQSDICEKEVLKTTADVVDSGKEKSIESQSDSDMEISVVSQAVESQESKSVSGQADTRIDRGDTCKKEGNEGNQIASGQAGSQMEVTGQRVDIKKEAFVPAQADDSEKNKVVTGQTDTQMVITGQAFGSEKSITGQVDTQMDVAGQAVDSEDKLVTGPAVKSEKGKSVTGQQVKNENATGQAVSQKNINVTVPGVESQSDNVTNPPADSKKDISGTSSSVGSGKDTIVTDPTDKSQKVMTTPGQAGGIKKRTSVATSALGSKKTVINQAVKRPNDATAIIIIDSSEDEKEDNPTPAKQAKLSAPVAARQGQAKVATSTSAGKVSTPASLKVSTSKAAAKVSKSTPAKVATPKAPKVATPTAPKVATPTADAQTKAKVTAPSDVKVTTPKATQVATPSTTKVATPSTTKVATPSTTKVATPSTTKVANPSTTKVATPPTTKVATPSTIKVATPSTAKVATPSTTKVATTSTTKVATTSTTKAATSSTTNVATPSTTKAAAPSTTKVAAPSATKVATPSATKVATSTTKVATQSTTKVATQSTTKVATQSTTKVATQSTTKVASPSTTKVATPTTTKIATASSTKVATPTKKVAAPSETKVTTPTTTKVSTAATTKDTATSGAQAKTEVSTSATGTQNKAKVTTPATKKVATSTNANNATPTTKLTTPATTQVTATSTTLVAQNKEVVSTPAVTEVSTLTVAGQNVEDISTQAAAKVSLSKADTEVSTPTAATKVSTSKPATKDFTAATDVSTATAAKVSAPSVTIQEGGVIIGAVVDSKKDKVKDAIGKNVKIDTSTAIGEKVEIDTSTAIGKKEEIDIHPVNIRKEDSTAAGTDNKEEKNSVAENVNKPSQANSGVEEKRQDTPNESVQTGTSGSRIASAASMGKTPMKNTENVDFDIAGAFIEDSPEIEGDKIVTEDVSSGSDDQPEMITVTPRGGGRGQKSRCGRGRKPGGKCELRVVVDLLRVDQEIVEISGKADGKKTLEDLTSASPSKSRKTRGAASKRARASGRVTRSRTKQDPDVDEDVAEREESEPEHSKNATALASSGAGSVGGCNLIQLPVLRLQKLGIELIDLVQPVTEAAGESSLHKAQPHVLQPQESSDSDATITDETENCPPMLLSSASGDAVSEAKDSAQQSSVGKDPPKSGEAGDEEESVSKMAAVS